MKKLSLTRREFIEVAGAAATATQLNRGVPLEALTLPSKNLDGGVRHTVAMNRNWSFARQASPGSAVEARFVGAEKLGYDDSSWSDVWLPHSWDVGPDNPFATRGHFRGIGWYRTRVNVPRAWRGRSVRLDFKGAMQVADVWLNGVHVGSHVGGYTGFSMDLTPAMKFGTENLIAVKVDDTLSPYIAPPEETNVAVYGGIYRTVSLTACNPVHIPENGVWVTWDDQNGDASVTVHGSVRNQSSSPSHVKVGYRILDGDGTVRGQAQAEAQTKAQEDLSLSPATILISKPQLWSPDSPHLYTLQATVRRGSEAIDQHSIRFGVRYMTHDAAQGFLLNGAPINLHGVDRRQDYGFLGDAVPEAVGVKDVRLMKEMGVNFYRTAHYPQDPAVLDACDELGILVWEEIPNIQIESYPPGLMLSGRANVTIVRYSRPYIRNLKAQLKEMIEQNRNRPSVIMWSLGDDLSEYQYPEDFVELSDYSHALDPTRWTAGRVPHVTDVLDATVYYNNPDLIEQHKRHPEGRYIWNEWGSFHSERSKEGPAFIRPDHDPVFADTVAANLCEGFLMQWTAMPWLGTMRWVMFDCGEPNTGASVNLWHHVNDKIKPRWPANDYYGCMDMWRLPKEGFYLFQSQWTEKPMIHITSHWTWPNEVGKPRNIRIYSNCDSVELFLNGRSLGTHKPASQDQIWDEFSTLHDKYFSGRQSQFTKERLPGSGLRHAPFVWENVSYQPGTLTAIGKKDGVTVKDEHRTAGKPAQLSLISDLESLAADGFDVARLQAHVLDSKGVLVPYHIIEPKTGLFFQIPTPWIKFSVDGPGCLLGGAMEIDAISGIAAINLQSIGKHGKITVRAESHGLRAASKEFTV